MSDGMNEWWKRQRAAKIASTSQTILGLDGKPLSSAEADLAAQSTEISFAFRSWHDRGFERINMLRTIVGGVCFLADNFNVSRETLVKMIGMTELQKDREFVFKP